MSANGRAVRRWLLAGALFTGLIARAPGVEWGMNFPSPSGFTIHHPDEWTHIVLAEPLIAPADGARWTPSYPKGLAVMTAAPIVASRVLRGALHAGRPAVRDTVRVGRIVSVLFGVASIYVVFLLGRRITGDERVGLAAAWFLALGGLHVSQSHFFVADVPALFFTLLGLYLLLVDLDRGDEGGNEALRWGALSLGFAFGIKLFVAGMPSLAVAALLRRGRIRRIAHGAIFCLAGFVIVNAGLFTPFDLLAAIRGGVNDPYTYNRAMGLLVYAIESPAVFGLPLLLFGLAGTVIALRRLGAGWSDRRVLTTAAVLGLPLLVHAWHVTFSLDLFPRHIVVFIPFAALAAGFALVRTADALAVRRFRPALLTVPVFAWMALFVFDGERPYIAEPRNEAYRWLEANVPEGTHIWWYYHNLQTWPQQRFPRDGRPPYLVEEMMQANHILSGVGMRDSYPRDYHHVFDVLSQQEVDEVQAVFRGQSEYREVARFREGYFMPEYRWSDRLLGNRSRNYITELVIFEREGA